VLGADLRHGQEPADPQHVALLPVANQERPVVGPLLAGRGDARAWREAPLGQQRGGELQPGGCRLAVLGDRRDPDIAPLRLPPVTTDGPRRGRTVQQFFARPGPVPAGAREVSLDFARALATESGLRDLRLERTPTSAWRRCRSLAGPLALPRRCGAEDRPSVAQLRWQKPADGPETMAMAQIRWHRTLFLLLPTCFVSDLDRPFCHPEVMVSLSVTPMHHAMSMDHPAVPAGGGLAVGGCRDAEQGL
jgi:hypothetical protein